MNNFDPIELYFSVLGAYVPTLIVCLIAGVVIFTKWRRASSGSLWALLGFGLALMLCFAMPLGHTILQYWVFESGDRESRMWVFNAFSMVGSVLHAVTYALLLVAVFAGRSNPDAPIPPTSTGGR